MKLAGISLQYFRSYQQRTFLFPQKTTVIVAKNASGKTSLIEAIALLSTGDSFRAEHVDEMISFEQELARIKGKVEEVEQIREEEDGVDEHVEQKSLEHAEVEIVLTRGILNGKKVQSRLYTVNGVKRRKKDFVGKFFTVVFRPEDMRLVEGSPSRRRQFIDTALSICHHAYADSLKTYEDALKRRNRLLVQVREGEMPRSVLTYWTSLVVKHGEILQELRRKFFMSFPHVEFPLSFTVVYEPSIMSEERIQEYAEREIAAGHTLIGPHKDDFSVQLPMNSHQENIALFGSRGQQRMAVLWLKVCELQYVQAATKIHPVLLLDDILSELDEDHRTHVLSLLNNGQAIITTTEEKMVAEIQHAVGEVEVMTL